MGGKDAIEAENHGRDVEGVADGGSRADRGVQVREVVREARGQSVELLALVRVERARPRFAARGREVEQVTACEMCPREA